jgi:deoxyribose-phosphate aldolase
MFLAPSFQQAAIPVPNSSGRGQGCGSTAAPSNAATLGTRRTVKKDHQAAWLIHAVKTIDLTTLSGDDTPGTVQRLCAKARQPIRPELLAEVGYRTAAHRAVCLSRLRRHRGRGTERQRHPGHRHSTGFPKPHAVPAQDRGASKDGASEIDIVISREHVLNGDWRALYDEVKAFREACGPAHMKAIIATGELGTLKNIMRASIVCMQAGSDFIKTSTGKEPTNATLAGSLVMVRAIRQYHEQTGVRVGFKPAGGIRTAKQALDWLILMKEELGDSGCSRTCSHRGFRADQRYRAQLSTTLMGGMRRCSINLSDSVSKFKPVVPDLVRDPSLVVAARCEN